MVSQIGSDNSSSADKLLWLLVVLIGAGAVAGYYYLADYSLLLRVLGLFISAGVALGLAYKTSLGYGIWVQWQDAIQEVRRIHWPTRQETVQTTLAVLAMVVVMGILLWTADFILLRGVKWLTGHWGA